jgi:hypothetical protein
MKAPVYHRIAAAAIGLAACRSLGVPAAVTPIAPAADLAIARSRLVPGETITWTVTFAGVQAARARMAVGASGSADGHKQIVVRAEAQSAGLVTLLSDSQEVVSSWIDSATGVPSQSEFYSVDAGRTQRVMITRAAGKAEQVITRARTGEAPVPEQKRTHLLPAAPVYDNLAGLAALRAWDPSPGARATLWAFAGTRLWRSVLELAKEEDLDTDLGPVRAHKIVATSVRMTPSLKEDNSRPPRSWTVWISSDDRRIPLRIDAHLDFGDVIVKVTSYATAQGED